MIGWQSEITIIVIALCLTGFQLFNHNILKNIKEGFFVFLLMEVSEPNSRRLLILYLIFHFLFFFEKQKSSKTVREILAVNPIIIRANTLITFINAIGR